VKQNKQHFGKQIILGRMHNKQDFVLSGTTLKQHKLITGISGMGKSRFIASICFQLLKEGIEFTLIDPHSDLCQTVLSMLVETVYFSDIRAYEQLMYIPFFLEDAHIPFNVFNQPGKTAHDIAGFVLEGWKRSWASSIGDGSATALENLLLSAVYTLVVNNCPLTDLYRLITDDLFRETLLPQIDDQFIRDFWKRKNATNLAESTLRRAFLLSYSPSLRYCLMQKENRINARYFMDNGISCLYDLSGLDPQVQRFLGSLITLSYEQAALSRSSLSESKRKQHMIVIDEFSVFVSQSAIALEHILTQARKFGVTLNLCCQTISQVKEVSDALQNALHITFRMSYEDASKIAPAFLDSTPKKNLSFWQSLVAPLDDGRLIADDKDGQDRQAWTRVIRELQRQECLIHVGEKTFKLRTFAVDDVGNTRELDRIKETYARLLLTKREEIEKQGNKVYQVTEDTGQGKQKKVPGQPNIPGTPANHTVVWLPDE